MTKITEEMLDASSKRSRESVILQPWDPRCEQYMRNNPKGTVKKSTTS